MRNRTLLTHYSDIVVELHEDGTYTIIKDRPAANFAPRDETVYGVRSVDRLRLPEWVMVGR